MPTKTWTQYTDEGPKQIGFKLSQATIDDVNVAIKVRGGFVVTPGNGKTANLIFTNLNWNVPQGITVVPESFPNGAEVEACASSAYYMTKPTCAAPIELKKKCGIPWRLEALKGEDPELLVIGSMPSYYIGVFGAGSPKAYGDLRLRVNNSKAAGNITVAINTTVSVAGHNYELEADSGYSTSVTVPAFTVREYNIFTSKITKSVVATSSTFVILGTATGKPAVTVTRSVVDVQLTVHAVTGDYIADLPNFVPANPALGTPTITPALSGPYNSYTELIGPAGFTKTAVISYEDITTGPFPSFSYMDAGNPYNSTFGSFSASGFVYGPYSDILHTNIVKLGADNVAIHQVQHRQIRNG